ncbi:AAA family ATPase [Nocardioides cavernae]|uniref:AAA family ATPase n=1 Tax=Nocardioides cavernae TaxID=1921566 RepID=A0ABR8N839_9ACTN|nr:AAA family ATPase [Nocardioides cavernae]MBD3923024.1 AAA family ATPase [Nocardioides cavernae]MBM7512056.1 tetratricopeptide (TPR) repeat protein [Nocardioides cavernae]
MPPGPHRELVDMLRDLHHRAGWPSLRRLAEQTGVSHTTVSKALSSTALPSWGTVELLVEALGGDVSRARELWVAASTPSADPETKSGAARIAGRVAELRVVRHHLTSGTGLLLVTGEAGIGKSALVGAAVASTDVFVAVGRCLHLSREMPLMPVADALRAVLEHDGRWMAAALTACPSFVAASLARLLPELDDGSGTRAPDDLWGHERLFAAVGSTLRALADERPLAVHLEDCHWADRSTLDLLTHVISKPSRPPIVATWRLDDPDVSDVHEDWLARTRRTDGVAAVDVPPLTPAETAEQLRLLLGSGADDLARRIHPRSQGLPLYTAELAAGPDAVALPRALADLLDRRIGDLDDVPWRVARTLGVAQRRMPPGVLRAATGLPPEAMDRALHQLARRRLLRSGTGDDAELAHPLFVEAVARRLVPGEAAEVHARLAETLGGAPGVEPAEVADHWLAAGRPDQEVSARIDAAIVAGARFAFPKELATWLRVLALWDAGHTTEDVDLWEVLVRAIDAAVETGEIETGHALADRAARLPLDQLSDSARAQVLHRLGSQLYEEGDGVGAEELLDQALRLLEPLPPSPELFRLLEDRTGLLLQMGRHREALDALNRSAELLEVADARFRGRHRASVLWRAILATGDAEAAVEEALRELEDDADPDPVAQLMIAANATDALLSTSAPAARVEELARAPLATAEAWELELSYPGALIRTNVCWAHLLEGNTHAARAWIEPITRSSPATNTAFAHLMLAAVELREGHAAAALRRSREADEHIRIHDQNWTLCLPWAAEIELWAGRASDTCPRLADVLARDLAGEPAAAAAPLLVALARAHAEVMDETAASSSLRRSASTSLRAQVAGASTDPFGPGVPDVATAANALLWEAELGRLEDRATVEVWVRAASQWDLLGRPHESAYCRWRAAQVALRDGRGAVATRLAVRARADARQHVPLADAATATIERAGTA